MFEQAPAGLWEEGDTDQPPRSVTVRASGTGWFTGTVSSASVALTAGPLTQERPGPSRPPIKHPEKDRGGRPCTPQCHPQGARLRGVRGLSVAARWAERERRFSPGRAPCTPSRLL